MNNKITEFADSVSKLYIYGAGNIAKGYFDILKHTGRNISGFIETAPRNKLLCNIPVYSVSEIRDIISSADGVIPGYTASNTDEIKEKFANQPKILDFDHRKMVAIDNEIKFLPILEKLETGYGKADTEFDPENWKDVLITRLDAIGDLVFITPFLRELKRNLPNARLHVVIRQANASLLENCPYVDYIYLFPNEMSEGELYQQCEESDNALNKVLEFYESSGLSLKTFDVFFYTKELLCGKNALEELILAFICGAKCRIGHIIGDLPDKRKIYEWMNSVFSHVSLHSSVNHEAAYVLEMLEDIGLCVKDKRMELWPGITERKKIAKLLEGSERKIKIALGIVASAETRTWRWENYVEFIKLLSNEEKQQYDFIMVGGNDAVKNAENIIQNIGDINVQNFTGKLSLNESAACMELCDMYVGSNTGLLHFASAFGKPSVTIYSELSDGKQTDGDAPERMGAWQVPYIDLIPPAGLDGCHGVCRMRYSHCINQITPDQVVDAVRRLLSV